MFGRDQRGVAALTVVIIVAVSTGAAVATPVIVDAADVNPDSPFYGLERLGERIRMVSDEDQMKERWNEYVRMANQGKGAEYRGILAEFSEKMQGVTFENEEVKQEVVMWMQGQMPGIGQVKLMLMENLCLKLQQHLPEAQDELENELACIENLKNQLPTADNEMRETIRARLRLIVERIREIVSQYENQLGEEIKREIKGYLEAENILLDVDVRVIIIVRPIIVHVENFENELEKFNDQLSEVQAMLEGTPENAPGRNAAERLVDLAIDLRDKAVDANNEGKIRKALALIHAAQVHLRNAWIILEHAGEWEMNSRENWAQWKEAWENAKQEWKNTWENMKQEWIENKGRPHFLENFGRPDEPMMLQWRERLQERWRERWHGG